MRNPVLIVLFAICISSSLLLSGKGFAASETFGVPGTAGTVSSGTDPSRPQGRNPSGEEDFTSRNNNGNGLGIFNSWLKGIIEKATKPSGNTPGALPERQPPPSVMIRVPLLEGKPLEKAQQLLARLGLVAEPVTTAESDRAPNTVIEQSPKPDTPVQRGSSVALVIARAIMVTVPDVTGLSLAEARELIEQAGLAPVTNQTDGERVESQRPEANLSVVKGSQVVLQLMHTASTEPPKPPQPQPPPPQPPQKELPLTEIIAGSAVALLLGGAYLFSRTAKNKPGIHTKHPQVSIHETIDFGTQSVERAANSEELPAISIAIRPDPGIQKIERL